MNKSFSYLHTPSNSKVNPPVNTKKSTLPIEELSWEDFEKLCLRLVELNHSIDNCEIFGVKGQKQDGIDIFAKNDNGKYSTFQCKKYEKLTITNFKKAVNLFKKESWYSKSKEFTFCTSFKMDTTQFQKEFNNFKTELKKDKIKLIKWDKVQICRLLKKHPKIVYDFFGKEWVKLFNGSDHLNSIRNNRKLDANDLATLRNELFQFYSVIFNFHDSGIGLQELKSNAHTIQDRFIMPDAYEHHYSDNYNNEINDDEIVQNTNEYNKALNSLLPDSDINIKNNLLLDLKRKRTVTSDISIKNRVNIDLIISKNRKSIIIGDPGSGKTTLLRNLTLDLLSKNPKFLTTAKNWGKHLPIWMPFAFITKNLKENNNLSISDLLKIWFKSHENESFFELIIEALNDERLILIIDGIDELADLSSAQQAISKIEIQAELTNSKVIYSSRPYGYKILLDSFPKITEIYLLPFSEEQQRKFVFYWFEKWVISIISKDTDYAKKMTSDFISDLKRNLEIKKLAETPLLLSILISQRLRDSILPNNKTKALEKITEYLITIHPKKRKTSASIIENQKYNFELIDIFEELAIHIQMNFNDGIIDKDEAKKVIENYLVKLLGFKRPEAKKHSDEIFNIGANDYGIIIEKTSHEIAFTHRLFQEYLAAKYMYNSEEHYKEILSIYGGTPLWNQVIKLYFSLIPNSRIKQFSNSLNQIGCANKNKEYDELIKFLKFDIALSFNNSPLNVTRNHFDEIIPLFENETDYTRKKTYWAILLNSLNNQKIKDDIKKYLFKYFPNYYKYQDYRIFALKNIEVEKISQVQMTFLVTSLINGNVHQKIDASKTIQKFIKNEWLFNEINRILNSTTNPTILPYIINCFISDELDKATKISIYNFVNHFEHVDIRFYVLKLKIHLKIQNNKDFKDLISLQSYLGFEFKDDMLNMLIDGWPNDQNLLSVCLDSIRKPRMRNRNELESETAWKILFHSFSKEEKVLARIISEIKNEEYPFIGFDSYRAWSHISHYFRDNKKLIPIVDKWIIKQKYREPEICFASQIGRTKIVKEYLIDLLPKAHFSHWITQALLDGWKDDNEVINILKKYFKGDNNNRKASFHYLDLVFKDDIKNGIKLAEEIIFDKSSAYRERAIDGLIKLDKKYFKNNVLEKFIKNELPFISNDDIWNTQDNIVNSLIINYKEEKIVKDFAFSEFFNSPKNHYFLIQSYPKEIDVIDEMLLNSLPIDYSFRIELMEKFEEQGLVDMNIINKLSEFDDESDKTIMITAGISYFKHLLDINPNRIIEICRKKVFARGFDYEYHRQLAFCGYLLTKNLKTYFSFTEKEQEKKPNPEISYDDSFKEISNSTINLLIDNFDYLYSVIEGNFNMIKRYKSDDEQVHWSFWAKYSTTSTSTFNHVNNFIIENEDIINSNNLLIFLDRVKPQSNLLKNICLRLVIDNNSVLAGQLIGKNFNKDQNIYNELIKIDTLFNNDAKIIALSIGWPNAPILKKIFLEIEKKPTFSGIDNYAYYHIKFLFKKADEIIEYLNKVFNNFNEYTHHHKFYINPLKTRIKNDIKLQNKIKNELLITKNLNTKISLYAILNSINSKDNDIVKWRDSNECQDYIGNYGYNILTNDIIPFSNVLNPLTYSI